MFAVPGADDEGAEGGNVRNMVLLAALIMALSTAYGAYQRRESETQARAAAAASA